MTPGSPIYHPVNIDPDYLSGKILDRYADVHPKTWRNFSARRRERIREEFRALAGSLGESLATASPAILIDHAHREQARSATRHIPAGFVVSSLEIMGDVLARELPPDYREQAGAFVRAAVTALKSSSAGTATGTPLSPVARSLLDAILAGDSNRGGTIIDEALAAGTPVRDIYLHVFQPVLRETGRLWEQNEASVAQEHYVSGFIRQSMARMHDRIAVTVRKARGAPSVVTASVGGELHDIGIRMVADFFEMDGWDVYYTGANTPVKCIIDAVKERKADAVAVSVTMPSRLPEIEYLIRSLRADPATAPVKIIVGGYPFGILPVLWKQVGADACASGADDAVTAANRLTDSNR